MNTIKKFYKSIFNSVKDFAILLGAIAGVVVLLIVKIALTFLIIKGVILLFVYGVTILTSPGVVAIAMVVIATVVFVEFSKYLFALLKKIFTKKLVVEITDGELTT
jgi:hypothetical protein